MVHHISNRHIQADVNNVKLIILDYLGAKKFLWLIIHKQSFCLEGNTLQTFYRVKYAQK